MISIAISMTALLFSISGFVLGLLGFIQARSSAQSTHTVQMQEAPAQKDISQYFGPPDGEEDFTLVPNDELENTILKGLV